VVADERVVGEFVHRVLLENVEVIAFAATFVRVVAIQETTRDVNDYARSDHDSGCHVTSLREKLGELFARSQSDCADHAADADDHAADAADHADDADSAAADADDHAADADSAADHADDAADHAAASNSSSVASPLACRSATSSAATLRGSVMRCCT
jgi:hypothetical protein